MAMPANLYDQVTVDGELMKYCFICESSEVQLTLSCCVGGWVTARRVRRRRCINMQLPDYCKVRKTFQRRQRLHFLCVVVVVVVYHPLQTITEYYVYLVLNRVSTFVCNATVSARHCTLRGDPTTFRSASDL